MIKKYIQWLDGLNLKRKVVYAILAVLLLVLLPEVIAPFIEWKILITHLHDWFNNNYWFLLRLFLCGAALLLLYGFFVRGKLGLFFGKLIQHRVLLVLFVGVVEGILVYNYWHDAINYFRVTNDKGDAIGSIPVWMGTFITTLIAAPVALLIWAFRNEDKRLDLQHAEENIRQADFHKIEEWATTFPTVTTQKTKPVTTNNQSTTKEPADSSKSETSTKKTNTDKPVPSETKEGVLQVAAIYQLLPYLKGEYGDRFVRPTMEIYRTLLSSWQWSEEDKEKAQDGKKFNLEKPDYIVALHTIFRQEVEFFRIFHEQPVCTKNNWIPLREIDLKGADFNYTALYGTNFEGANLSNTNFSHAILNGTNLIMANLHGAYLFSADLSRVALYEAELSKADIGFANLFRAVLRKANLEGANLEHAYLIEADLREADFSGTDFCGADLTGATYDDEKIKKAIMDETTILKDGSYWKKPEEDSDQKPD